MIYYENRLQNPTFFRKLGKMLQNVSSAGVL